MNYKEQLADSRWLRKKNEILERDNYTCQHCGRTSNLNVHHLSYEKGKLAWDYPNEKLITLCVDCHEKIHREQNEKFSPVKRGDWYYTTHGDFMTCAIVIEVDFLTKTIYFFGTNQGAWGSGSIFCVNFKDFHEWSELDLFALDENDECYAEYDYFLWGMAQAYLDLKKHSVNIFGDCKKDMIEYIAEHYFTIYVQKNEFLSDYFDKEGINYE